jgi:hypothetical protein
MHSAIALEEENQLHQQQQQYPNQHHQINILNEYSNQHQHDEYQHGKERERVSGTLNTNDRPHSNSSNRFNNSNNQHINKQSSSKWENNKQSTFVHRGNKRSSSVAPEPIEPHSAPIAATKTVSPKIERVQTHHKTKSSMTFTSADLGINVGADPRRNTTAYVTATALQNVTERTVCEFDELVAQKNKILAW